MKLRIDLFLLPIAAAMFHTPFSSLVRPSLPECSQIESPQQHFAEQAGKIAEAEGLAVEIAQAKRLLAENEARLILPD